MNCVIIMCKLYCSVFSASLSVCRDICHYNISKYTTSKSFFLIFSKPCLIFTSVTITVVNSRNTVREIAEITIKKRTVQTAGVCFHS